MKKILLTLTLSLFTLLLAQAQTGTDAEVIKTKKSFLTPNTAFKKPSKDYVMLQAGFNTWLLSNAADSLINLASRRGHELAAYVCYDFPLSKKGLSFGAGAGISSSNIYLSNQTLSLKDTFVRFSPLDTSITLKRYKMSANYLEAPFEFRWFGNKDNRNRGLKISLGLKIGTLINFHTKAVGTAFNTSLKEKESSRRLHSQWRITPGVRIGWGNFSVYGNYQLSDVFRAGNTQGNGITPISIGACISGL
jgi:hypothetical protein